METTRITLAGSPAVDAKSKSADGYRFAEVIDVTTLRNRDRKHLLRTIKNPEKAMEAGLEMQDGLAALIVAEWNVLLTDLGRDGDGPAPLPKDDLTVLDDLPIGWAVALEQGAVPAMKALFPDFDPSPKADSPTAPSSV